jgi:gliding motility-associated-like protein
LGNAVPYNGHFYEFVSTPVTYTVAKSAANARSYFGLQGYLVTIADSFENNYVFQKLSADAWMGAADEFSEINSATGTTTYANQTAAEGNWYWVTGPEKGTKFAVGNSPSTVQPGKYMNWSNFEPNNAGAGGEHYVQFFSTNAGKWNDLANGMNLGFVCEYGGMPGDPTLVLSYARNILPLLINPATVITASPTLVATTLATLGGNVTADGGASVTERGIVYSTSANPTTANTKVQMGTGLGTFSQMVTSLNPSTTYHVRAYAINNAGTSYGADSIFTTPTGISLPIVTTGTATAVSTTFATLGGNVLTDGGTSLTERGIVFATTANPTTANSKVQMGTGTGVYSQTVTALTANTTYHYRAYAINSVGTAYGIDSTFKTLEVSVFNENLYNAFSPDGDGINDNWVIDNAADLNGHEIVVFNIFGQEVFHQTGYTNAWDGKIDGNPVPSGEYYYLIKGPKINTKGALLIKNKQ